MKKIILSVVLLATTICELSAQTVPTPRSYDNRASMWTETNFMGAIKGKFSWQLDYQYRREADQSNVVGGDHSNIVKNPYQHVYRPWIHYQMNEHVRFSLSPLGYWATWIPAAENKGTRLYQPELRICPQITLTNYVGRVRIDQRYRYEFRFQGQKLNNNGHGEFDYGQGDNFPMIGANGAAQKQRLRYYVRALIPLGNHQKLENKTFYFNIWNEFFLGMGKNTPSDKIFDQNRTFALIGYKFDTKFPIRLEAGYGLQVVNGISSSYQAGTNTIPANSLLTEKSNMSTINNIAQVYLIFEDFNKIFKRKEKPKPEEVK